MLWEALPTPKPAKPLVDSMLDCSIVCMCCASAWPLSALKLADGLSAARLAPVTEMLRSHGAIECMRDSTCWCFITTMGRLLSTLPPASCSSFIEGSCAS